MYKDRIPYPHQLSYSAVTSLQSSGIDSSSQVTQYGGKDETQKYLSNNRKLLKPQTNSDLAFLRNTVGPISTSDHSYLRVNDSKKIDMSLRQTMNVTSDFKNFLIIEGPISEKRTSRAQTVGDLERNKKSYRPEQKKDDRLSKIMQKYEKKNQTKQALKLLEQLKQLKKKQQQLKKQRKNDPPKETQNSKKSNGNVYQINSPINFSKKNKVNYYTPTYQNKSLSTNTNSPHNNQTSMNGLGRKESYDLVKQDVSITVNRKPYEKLGQSISLNEAVQNLFMSSHPTKSTINLKVHQDNQMNLEQSRGFSKHEKNDYLSQTITQGNSIKQNKPQSNYKKRMGSSVTNQSVLTVTTRDNSYLSKSPSHKYKEPQSSLSNTVSVTSSKYRIHNSYTSSSSSYSSTNLRDVFLNKRVTINDFILGKNLGQGKFGTVFQAYDKKTKSIYALKKISKSTIKSHWMIDQFMLEVKIQNFCNHPNILSMHGVFEDAEHVYILLEYMEQGTLFLHLKKNTTLNQKQAAIKIKQIASAIQYLHENGIAHRDLKPENIVMSHGVCKLCDFGWATICDQRRKTYCGTFDYAAPEILQGEQYDMSVDLWCLGILTYEILVGKAPFYHISRKETMKKIMNCQNQQIAYPSTMSNQAKSFIEHLLKRNPEQRLKSEDLLKHPFILMADK